MALQTTGNLSAETRTYYDRVLLEAALPTLFHRRWGQERNIPQREGQTVQFRRWELFGTKTTPLQEGITPPSDTPTISTVTATPLQYGGWTEVSDVLTWTAPDRVLTEEARLQGTQAGETLDEVTRDVLVAGTTVRYAGGQSARANVSATDKINGDELRKLRRTLRKNKARPLSREGGTFAMLISPDTHYDLQSMPEWLAMSENSSPEEIKSGMVKRMWGFSFFETEKAKVFSGAGAGSIDVHASVAIGADAYGLTSIEGHALETIMHPVGSAGTADPLNQRATVGWKATFTAVRLNELFLARLEHAVTA